MERREQTVKQIDKTGWVVGDVLAQQGAALADVPFVQCEDQPPLTFGSMDETANRVANALADLGVQRGDRVLVMLPNSLAFLHAWFGINRLGAVLVPINTAYKGAFLEHVINNAAARVMIIASEFVPILQASEAHVPSLDTAVIVDASEGPVSSPEFARLRALPFRILLEYPATQPWPNPPPWQCHRTLPVARTKSKRASCCVLVSRSHRKRCSIIARNACRTSPCHATSSSCPNSPKPPPRKFRSTNYGKPV